MTNNIRNNYGKSALTTYEWLRGRYNMPAIIAFRLMKLQKSELGANYEGGLECTKYRRKDAFKLLSCS